MSNSDSRFPGGALLINKHAGVSSFGVIELLQRGLMEAHGLKRRDLPKLGHGGTLDPFATGLLAVCVGRAVKLARYFLGSKKTYEGVIRFGETTVPGDPTAPVSETSNVFPETLEEIQKLATPFTLQPYLQTPPMHSAKKKNGKPLYELARQGIEIERDPKICQIHSFRILSYEKPRARFRVECSSGTYIRTLAQDLGRLAGSVALLEELVRTASGSLHLAQAMSVDEISAASRASTPLDELPCWVPFDLLLDGYERAEATLDEANSLLQGKQNVLFNILNRATGAPLPQSGQENQIAIYSQSRLIAVANQMNGQWGLERVFAQSED